MPETPQRQDEIVLSVRGMSCAACVRKVEEALRAVPGAREASVNLALARARVRGAGLGAPELIASVAALGYRASLYDPASERREREAELAKARREALGSAAGAALLAAAAMGPMLAHRPPSPAGLRLQAALAAAALLGFGRGLLLGGLKALLSGAPDMGSLVLLGAAAALLRSAPALLGGPGAHAYLEAAAVPVATVLLGRWLLLRAQAGAADSLRAAAELFPRQVRVLGPAGESTVPLADLRPGDLVLVPPGERIPADGEVEGGESAVDESSITGEPLPLRRAPGDRVLAGTANGSGALRVRARATGEDTLVAEILRQVEAAQAEKPPIQDLADRVARVFVPAVLALAAAVLLAWGILGPAPSWGRALAFASSTLLIACPCAMGLATPAAILAASARAARMGIAVRSPAALQALALAREAAFDKTGTLTEGRPRLVALETLPGMERREALSLAACAESGSEHPLARAILEAARAEGLAPPPPERFLASPGLGASAELRGRALLIGSERLLAEAGVGLGALAEPARGRAARGETVFFLAVDGRPAALLAVADALRPGARGAVASLRELGLALRLLSGDRPEAVEAAARELGIGAFEARLLPAEKAAAVSRLAERGPVVFVGDGVNDAPALAVAGAGVALGSGSAAAASAAGLILLAGGLESLPGAVRLSRATLRVVRQNLFWAFAYNALLLPVAAGALAPRWGVSLDPMLAAGAMTLSSLFVLANSLRLWGHPTHFTR